MGNVTILFGAVAAVAAIVAGFLLRASIEVQHAPIVADAMPAAGLEPPPPPAATWSVGIDLAPKVADLVDLAAITRVTTSPETIAQPVPAIASAAITTVYLRVDAGLGPEGRQRIEAALAKAGYRKVVMEEMPFSISRSRVGYFREADRASAEALIAALRGVLDKLELRDYHALLATPDPGRLDLWVRS